MSRLKASTSFAIPCPPGFAGWAKSVLKPETFDRLRSDTGSCMRVLGAYVFALRNAGIAGTNWERIPEVVLTAYQRKRPHDGTALVPQPPPHD